MVKSAEIGLPKRRILVFLLRIFYMRLGEDMESGNNLFDQIENEQ